MLNPTGAVAVPQPTRRATLRLAAWFDNERRLGLLMILPALLVVIVLVGYPFALSIYLALTNTEIARADTGTFVGLQNFVTLLNRSVFRDKVLVNTVLYTVGTVPLKLFLGLLLALILNRPLPLRLLWRGLVLLPWVVPTSLSMTVFIWMFEPTYSILNYIGESLRLIDKPIQWLGTPALALFSITMVNIWRGTPFFAVTILAGLQVVPQEQVEAAMIDGANVFQRFRFVVLPWIRPVIAVATLFSVVRTFAEVEIVMLLTRGGPFNSTHMVGTYAYQQAIQNSKLGEGAAISLFFFPVLVLVVVLQLRYLQRREA
jgi:multiple sugar transport system permease protein